MNWQNLTILVTGGTGSFGKKFTKIMLQDYYPKKLIIFSRDELKQHEMRMSGFSHPSLRRFVRDAKHVNQLWHAVCLLLILRSRRRGKGNGPEPR